MGMDFFGQIQSSLGNLTQLSISTLAGNDFSGSVPPTLGSCQHLQLSDLSHNKLNGVIPACIMGISSLSISLDFSKNNLESLEKLDLSY